MDVATAIREANLGKIGRGQYSAEQWPRKSPRCASWRRVRPLSPSEISRSGFSRRPSPRTIASAGVLCSRRAGQPAGLFPNSWLRTKQHVRPCLDWILRVRILAEHVSSIVSRKQAPNFTDAANPSLPTSAKLNWSSRTRLLASADC